MEALVYSDDSPSFCGAFATACQDFCLSAFYPAWTYVEGYECLAPGEWYEHAYFAHCSCGFL